MNCSRVKLVKGEKESRNASSVHSQGQGHRMKTKTQAKGLEGWLSASGACSTVRVYKHCSVEVVLGCMLTDVKATTGFPVFLELASEDRL